MVEPLAVSWRAVKRSQIRPGNSILVLGAGPVSVDGRCGALNHLTRVAGRPHDNRGAQVSLKHD